MKAEEPSILRLKSPFVAAEIALATVQSRVGPVCKGDLWKASRVTLWSTLTEFATLKPWPWKVRGFTHEKLGDVPVRDVNDAQRVGLR